MVSLPALLLLGLAFLLQLGAAVLLFSLFRLQVPEKVAWLFPLRGKWLQRLFALVLFLTALGVLKFAEDVLRR